MVHFMLLVFYHKNFEIEVLLRNTYLSCKEKFGYAFSRNDMGSRGVE